MAEKYDKNATYVFTSKDGKSFTSKGDNGFVWQAMESGLPISVNDKGEWTVDPYIERNTDGTITAYIPQWFKETDAYNAWKDLTGSLTKDYTAAMTKTQLSNLNDYLKGLGSQGVLQKMKIDYAKSFGLDDAFSKNYFDMVLSAYTEIGGGDDAKIDFGSGPQSVKDIMNEYNNMSKEELSAEMTKYLNVLSRASENQSIYGSYFPRTNKVMKIPENPQDIQAQVANALIRYDILNAVGDKGELFADGKYKDILEASGWQKWRTGLASFSSAMAQNPLTNLLMSGVNAISGIKETPQEYLENYIAKSSAAGANLEGRETAISVGGISGTVSNIALTAAEIYLVGAGAESLGGWMLSRGIAPGVAGFLSGVSTFVTSPVGMLVSDFVINDLPQDIAYFIMRGTQTGDWRGALLSTWSEQQEPKIKTYDKNGNLVVPTQEYDKQKLIPFMIYPVFDENGVASLGAGIGPEVPSGLITDIAGDIIVDLTLPIFNNVFKVVSRNLDAATNGTITRIKNSITMANLKLQEGFDSIPGIGKAWMKIVDFWMGPNDANLVREARKASIAKGVVDPYLKVHNNLTARNHRGSESVTRVYIMLDKKWKVSESAADFVKNKNSYGGKIDKVKIEYTVTIGGKEVKRTKIVDDVLPKQVKEEVMAIERLSELKGLEAKEEGIIQDSKRLQEIAELEKKVESISPEVKDFADRLSGLNKDVERMGVAFGVTNEDWFNHIVTDPQFEKYMTRQAIVQTQRSSSIIDGQKRSAQWTKSRTGNYSDHYLDPLIALNMKVAALGRAVVDNEIAKSLVGFQRAQGSIVKGERGIDLGERIKKNMDEVHSKQSFREAIGYDGAVGKFSSDMKNTASAVQGVWDMMIKPEEISVKSIYRPDKNPVISSHVTDFQNGKISFADGAREAAGLSDADASVMIRNTYRVKTGDGVAKDIPDNAEFKPTDVSSNLPDYAGVTADGVPYSYKVENGKITDIKKITTPEGLADSINSLGYGVSVEHVRLFGTENAYALNRTALYYRDNVPSIPLGSKFAIEPGKGNALGWIDYVGNPRYDWAIEGGHITGNFTARMNTKYYLEKNTDTLKRAGRNGVAGWDQGKVGFHPKNSDVFENTPIHETGHAYMLRLTVLDINRRIDNGEFADYVKMWKNMSPLDAKVSIGRFLDTQWVDYQVRLGKRAMDRLGVAYNGNNWGVNWRRLSGEDLETAISRYAASNKHGEWKYETFAEAFVDYWANGEKASPWTLALMEETFAEAKRYGMATSPKEIMEGNGLDISGVVTDNGYAFPEGTKTARQKAAWLDEQRRNNPYIGDSKTKFTTENYQKANLWDTYFQKEILAFDDSYETKIPDALVKKNADFQEDVANNGVKYIMDKIKENAVEGFDNELATIMLSRNSDDISDALEDFISRRIDASARAIAEKMGGEAGDNLDKVRITLYSDEQVKADTIKMVNSLMPDMDTAAATKFVEGLFDARAKGFASVEGLPVETKQLIAETDQLREALHKENKSTFKYGKNKDKGLIGKYVDDTTHIITYREAGEDVYVVVKDPVVASILKRPNNFKETGLVAESFVHMGNFLARTYRLGTTGVNPVSLVRNVLRDPLQATLTAGFNPLDINLSPVAFYKTLRNFGLDDATIKTVTEKLSDWASGQTLTQQLRGSNINANTLANSGYRSDYEKALKKLDKVTNNKVVEVLEKPLEMWESMLRNQIAQQSFTKAFRATGDVERSMSRAMFDASNATTNFSHSINKFQRAASTVPYLTSAINGTASFWRLFNIDPVGMVARIGAGFMVPVMAITAWNLSSEERRKSYLNTPEWWRDGHLILMDENGDKIFAITIPEEVSAYYGTVRRLIEYTHDANPASIPTILAQGGLGLLPGDMDGFVDEQGNWQLGRGLVQFTSGLMPQAVTTIYEWVAEQNLYTGADLSYYTFSDKVINAFSNTFGTGAKNIINDIGFILGASEKDLLGKTTADTLARDLFGLGFDEATNQFLNIIGKASSVDERGKEIKATGLHAENEKLQKQIETLTKDYAFLPEEEKAEVDAKKQKLIDDFTNRVATMVNKYMQLYSMTGGLTAQQKNQVVSILNLGQKSSSASGNTAEAQSLEDANSDEYSLAVQRYVNAGLPAGPTIESLAKNQNGNTVNSLEVKAALNRYYGESKQATADLKVAIEKSGLKDIKNEFYDFISAIYDAAEEQGKSPDYDMIEKVQARYLQAVDAALIPIINKYGNNILSNNSFIDELRTYVNGMIPSDDWRQSARNAKKFLSTKDFPTATVDVKKWLQQRYGSSMRDRDIASDQIVTDTLEEIKSNIDTGKYGVASAKIQSLITGMQKANFYISAKDLQTLYSYRNMLK